MIGLVWLECASILGLFQNTPFSYFFSSPTFFVARWKDDTSFSFETLSFNNILSLLLCEEDASITLASRTKLVVFQELSLFYFFVCFFSFY